MEPSPRIVQDLFAPAPIAGSAPTPTPTPTPAATPAATGRRIPASEKRMKHAGEPALDALEDVLQGIRRIPDLTERKRGIFYKRAGAFLHFHEDPAGLFADLREESGWRRLRVSTRAERRALVTAARRVVGNEPPARGRGAPQKSKRRA
ncbi:MAG: hypothetical protein HYZ53_20385 [Planctomycetes bacterium]|nr:hypothetical protein [Planctomycetota bacterium]